MSDQNAKTGGADRTPEPKPMQFLATKDDAQRFAGRMLLLSGVAMIVMGAMAFFYMIWSVFGGFFEPKDLSLIGDDNMIRIVLIHYPNLFFPTFVGVISIVVGIYLMGRSLSASSRTIPDEDRLLLEELIRAKDKEGVDQYIKLSALLGSSGFFTKLGFTGLPLATVALTLVLVALALWQAPVGEAVETNLLDMAKLTLGAFLGSFVQRKIGREAALGEG